MRLASQLTWTMPGSVFKAKSWRAETGKLLPKLNSTALAYFKLAADGFFQPAFPPMFVLKHMNEGGGMPSPLWIYPTKAKLGEIKLIGEEVDHPYRVVLGNIVFQLRGKQRSLSAIRSVRKTRHPIPRPWHDGF